MFKFSVIIPIYNANKTINRCVDSLLNAANIAMTDVEIILVNDGSADHSGEICKKYAETDTRIQYIEKDNGGVSSARNMGLDHAKGEYILFVDSDDYVSLDFFEKIDKIVDEYDYDFIVFGAAFYRKGNIVRKSKNKSSKSIKEEKTVDLVTKLIVNKTICSPCAKVYKKDIIETNHIRFIESISISEDWNFNIRYALNIESIYVSGEANYCVTLDNGSSLSRTEIGDIKRQQIDFSGKSAREAIVASQKSEKEKDKIRAALDFGKISQVYSEAKIDYRKGLSKKERRINTRTRCSDIQKEKVKCPPYLYCRLVALPVKMYMSGLINRFAEYLVKR